MSAGFRENIPAFCYELFLLFLYARVSFGVLAHT
jgi:hypothetical protein